MRRVAELREDGHDGRPVGLAPREETLPRRGRREGALERREPEGEREAEGLQAGRVACEGGGGASVAGGGELAEREAVERGCWNDGAEGAEAGEGVRGAAVQDLQRSDGRLRLRLGGSPDGRAGPRLDERQLADGGEVRDELRRALGVDDGPAEHERVERAPAPLGELDVRLPRERVEERDELEPSQPRQRVEHREELVDEERHDLDSAPAVLGYHLFERHAQVGDGVAYAW